MLQNITYCKNNVLYINYAAVIIVGLIIYFPEYTLWSRPDKNADSTVYSYFFSAWTSIKLSRNDYSKLTLSAAQFCFTATSAALQYQHN